jgi:hypothetical protein
MRIIDHLLAMIYAKGLCPFRRVLRDVKSRPGFFSWHVKGLCPFGPSSAVKGRIRSSTLTALAGVRDRTPAARYPRGAASVAYAKGRCPFRRVLIHCTRGR